MPPYPSHLPSFFFFNDPAPTEISPLSLPHPLPICRPPSPRGGASATRTACSRSSRAWAPASTSRSDRKSTRLNSSHSQISYAVFCLKKKQEDRFIKL